MSFICLEGLDKTGKSTVAEYYRKQGYEVVHLSAPDKKYQDEYYTGPSYLDEIVDLLMQYDGKNVVWDRSWFGEKIWPHVYGRKPCLTDEDFEIIQEYEDRNNTQRILMIDPDIDAHWQRCVENNEPLNKRQFDIANSLYSRLAHSAGFIPQTLGDYDEKFTRAEGKDTPVAQEIEEPNTLDKRDVEHGLDADAAVDENKAKPAQKETKILSPIEEKLERANAINSILAKRIVKSKGEIYDQIETDIKKFLKDQLSVLMGNTSPESLSSEEIQILKVLCKQWQSKLKEK
jgi:hypothetical protein